MNEIKRKQNKKKRTFTKTFCHILTFAIVIISVSLVLSARPSRDLNISHFNNYFIYFCHVKYRLAIGVFDFVVIVM